VNDVASDGSTPLLLATVRGHLALIDMLLDKGADPNKDDAGFTALHWAAGSWESTLTGAFGIHAKDTEWSVLGGLEPAAKVKLVKALLARGANPNAQLKKQPPRFGFTVFALRLPGATPFVLAALAADVDVMRILLASGADPSLATNEGTTALMVAAGTGRAVGETRVSESSSLEAAKLALQVGGNVNAANKNGDTALHGAAGVGADRMVTFLVENGATVNAANKNGRTPLDAAMGRGAIYYESTATLLRKFGATEGVAPAPSAERK
jgi:ankyrin repeat protein